MKTGIALVLIAAGLVMGGREAVNSWAGSNVTELEQKEVISAAGITGIVAKTTTVDVRFVQGDGEEITARLYGKMNKAQLDKYELKQSIKDGVLQVQIQEERWGWIFGFRGSPDLEITLPKQKYEKLAAELTTGDLQASGVEANEIQFETTTGDVNLNHVKAGSIRIDSTTGDVTMARVEGKIDTHATTGDIKVTTNGLNQDINVDTKSGDVRIRTGGVPAAYAVDLKATTGDVASDLTGLLYEAKSEKRAVGHATAGGPKVYVRTTTGNITLSE